MKYLGGEYYVEMKDQRFKIHPTDDNVLQKRDTSISPNLSENSISSTK